MGNEIERKRFSKPVRVLLGLGYPAEISTVMQAYALLSDWPPSRRDAAHAIALDTCKTAFAAAGSSEAARRMFVAFARKNDLLAPESPPWSADDAILNVHLAEQTKD
ncbi:DUF982 domain-containing protein [Mesorhizobium sp. M0488]|uniref:DUF982 domain-containing protein n=1 Tax=unclassified Mesorhizobium TaxID=325217 RepID=UPI00333BFD41